MTTSHHQKNRLRQEAQALHAALQTNPLPGITADSYRIATYADGLIGATPESDVLRPKWGSGLKWGSASSPQPGDSCWGAGVAGGVKWDGTFHRDLARYSASGPLFWASYLKAGTIPGMQGGYWINFGNGWSHLHNDDPHQILTGASQKLFYDTAAGHWTLTIEATMFVTAAVVNVWTGTKTASPDPVGTYTRTTGLDPLATLTVEAN